MLHRMGNPIGTCLFVRSTMNANGFGRSSNGSWTKIPPANRPRSCFQGIVYSPSTKYSNPFELLSDSSIHPLNRVELPSKEINFSTFTSFAAISACFSNFLSHSTPHIKSVLHPLSDRNTVFPSNFSYDTFGVTKPVKMKTWIIFLSTYNKSFIPTHKFLIKTLS